MAVYDYQKLVKGMGYDIGAYADMKTGQPTGCDGLYGGTMETITNQLRKKYGLAETGVVDADLYGKIALELANKPDDSAKVAALGNANQGTASGGERESRDCDGGK